MAIAGFSLGLFTALISFFLTAPIFEINNTRVEGIETVNPKEIRTIIDNYLSSRAWLFFDHHNRFLFSTKNLEKKLNEQYSFLSLQITREKQSLIIIIKEKISSFVWITNDAPFLLDDNGVVIRSIPTNELDVLIHPPALQGPTTNNQPIFDPVNLLIFKDLEGKSVFIDQPLFSAAEIQNIKTLTTSLEKNQIYLKDFELNRVVGAWFKANTVGGFSILFDPTVNIDQQINNLFLVLREKISEPNKLEYIDVRFDNHVYYK